MGAVPPRLVNGEGGRVKGDGFVTESTLKVTQQPSANADTPPALKQCRAFDRKAALE